MTTTTSGLKYYWHIHHGVLCEALTEPLQSRIDYIKERKPIKEREIRLRLLTPVLHPERLPAQWREAGAKWREAYAKWREAYAKWKEADAKLREAGAKWKEAYAKWREAYAKWKEAGAKWREAGAKWKEAYAKCLPEIEALHEKEHPDCPWNGRTIFA